MTVYILGAGFSKAYEESPSKQKMPLAKEVFQTFNKLSISKNPNVLIGKILNYLKIERNLNYNDFSSFSEDIEKLYSEVETKLLESWNKEDGNNGKKNLYWSTYNELIFIFSSILNEIQNGPISKAHNRFVSHLASNDTLITFNWDTLIDRCLCDSGLWNSDTGYYVQPSHIYRDGWEKSSKEKGSSINLLKLHGSTNWLMSYPMFDKKNQFKFSHEGSPESFFVYESSTKEYPCYEGRYMENYQPFSYGYYPPNLPSKGVEPPNGHVFLKITTKTIYTPPAISSKDGLASIPLIIPPIKNKTYNRYGNLFNKIWSKAEENLSITNHIAILGYSFPSTDTPTIRLLKNALQKQNKMPLITIVNPNPEPIINLLKFECGLTNYRIFKEFINKDFDFSKVTNY